jgi:hypothetical protein
MMPALLKTLSLAAELTGAVKIILANGKRLLYLSTRNVSSFCSAHTTGVDVNTATCCLMSSTDGSFFIVCVSAAETEMKLKSFALFDSKT